MTQKKEAPSKKFGLGKRMLRITGIVLLSLLLLSAGAWFYVRSQKEKVAVMALEYFNETYRGAIAYDAISMDHWTGFSAPSIYFKNLSVVDTSATNHLRLQAAKLELEVSIKNLLQGSIQIKSVRLLDGSLLLDNYTPLTPEEEKGLPPMQDSTQTEKEFTNTLLEKNTRLAISDLDIEIRHHVKNKLFKFRVDEFNSDIAFSNESIRSRTYMDINIETLGFNLAKGRFVNGARARGSFESEFNLPGKQLNIASFPLELGAQVFQTSVHMNFAGVGTFDIALENQKTKFDATMGLLTENIRQKFAAIDLEGPFYTRTKLQGSFVYRDNPRVQVAFRTKDNTAIFDGEKRFSDLDFEGQFINRVYADEPGIKEDVKNFRIQLPQLHGRYKDIEFEIADMELASSPDAENAFQAEIRAGGSPESLNNFVADQHWNFQGGQFEMTASIDGDGPDIGSLIKASQSHFSLKNTWIINNDNKVGLPVVGISLSLSDNRARLEELRIAVSKRDDLILRAGFTNFSSLFEAEPKAKLRSDFRIESENLVWEDLLKLLDITGSGNETEKPEVALQTLLKDIQRKYDPKIDIMLSTFSMGPFMLHNVVSGMHFENEDLLILDKTSFGLPGGNMELEGSLNLGYEDWIPLDARLNGKADVQVLNLILDTEDLSLEGGNFQIRANLSGDLLRPDGILRNSSSSVILQDVMATYNPVEVVLPVTKLALELKEGHAELKALTLHVGEDDDITFSGRIQNLSTLLFGGTQGAVSSELHVQSERLVWEDYLQLFGAVDASQKQEASPDPESVVEADRKFKASLRDIYATLNPRITVDIAEFRYRDMEGFHDLRTAISFKDPLTVQLEETRFLHNRKTAVRLHAEIDIADSRETHALLEVEASGDPEELNDVLNNDTFLFEDGSFEVNALIRGNIEELDSLIAHSDTELNIQETFVLHKPSQVRIPIRTFQVSLQDNTAELKALEVELESGDRIALSGKVGHVSDLIFDVPPEESNTYSEVHLESARVSYKDFQELFALTEDTTATKAAGGPKTALKPAVRDIYHKFRPSLTISLDEFELDGLTINNLKTGFHFEGQDRIYLEESGFNFHDGSVSLNAHLDISTPDKTFFSFGFSTDRIDLDKLLKAFDHFNMPTLQSATKIGGLISLNTEMEGEIDGEGLIIPESLAGIITFDLEEAEIAGFEPLIEAGSKIFKEERLQDIRFSPIKNTLTLADMRLDIPLMEIQSSAFELFVAGHMGFGEVPTNVWIGFPLDNLKERDVRNVPDKKGYIAAGKKVFVEARSDDKKGMKYVLHLTPKQYYKERDMMEAYRREIREDRLRVRRYKRTGKLEDY